MSVHLGEHTGTKAVLEFQALCSNNIAVIATDNTMVVAYIKKGGGGGGYFGCSLYPTVENPDLVLQEIGDSSPTHSKPAECHSNKLSSLGQTIQTEWSLLPEDFHAMCSRLHQPQVDLFPTRFNNKLPQLVSPVLDPQAWAVYALSLPWEDLNPYAFLPVAILGKGLRSCRTTRARESF